MTSICNGVRVWLAAACAALVLGLLVPGPAPAQTVGFEKEEGYTGAAEGVPLTGQAGWYLPPGSSDHYVYTYKGNSLGLPANPAGGNQFIGGQALGDGTFPRAQINVDWSAASVWLVSYDLCVRFNGEMMTAVNNLSSFSLQDSTMARHFIALNTWVNIDDPTTFNANYIVFSAAGAQLDPQTPGPEWENLLADHWYRQYTIFDFASNRILAVVIVDLETGDFAVALPKNWYLAGGESPTLPLPTAMRFFVGGGTGANPGNVTGWDNLDVQPLAGPVPGRRASKRQLPPGQVPLAVTH